MNEYVFARYNSPRNWEYYNVMKSLYTLFIVTTLLKVLMGYLAINVSNVVTYNKVFSQQIALDVPQCLAYCYKCMYLKESQTIFVSNCFVFMPKDLQCL